MAGSGNQAKPPNVLIYDGENERTKPFERIHEMVTSCLNPEKYIVYHLSPKQALKDPWSDNARLVIIYTPEIEETLQTIFESYYHKGGKIISVLCNFDKRFVATKNIEDKNAIISATLKDNEDVFLCGGNYFYVQTEGSTVILHDANNQPVIMRCDRTTEGTAVLLQVDLFKNPADDPDKFDKLKQSNFVKIFKDIVSDLGFDTEVRTAPQLTCGFLYCQEESDKLGLLEAVKNSSTPKKPPVTLCFVEHLQEASEITAEHLPVVTEPEQEEHQLFKAPQYLQNLKTKTLGRCLIYVEMVPTTMTLFDGLPYWMIPGLVAVAGRQTRGQGRGGNVWISPAGCALFTLVVEIPSSSPLGNSLSLLQHLMTLAVVDAVKTKQGYEELPLTVKWPNDIYYKDKKKLGGVLVKTTTIGPNIYAFIGCGVNVDNSGITSCIKDLIDGYNKEHDTSLEHLSTSELIGRSISRLEELLEEYQSGQIQAVIDHYYSRWIHSDKMVTLQIEENLEVKIVGIDKFGYLLVEKPDGSQVSVIDDGNSFDIMKNMIMRKEAN